MDDAVKRMLKRHEKSGQILKQIGLESLKANQETQIKVKDIIPIIKN